MSTFFGFLSFICTIAFVIGMISPKIVLFFTARKSRGMVALVYLSAIFLFTLMSGATQTPEQKAAAERKDKESEKADSSKTAKTVGLSSEDDSISRLKVNLFKADSALSKFDGSAFRGSLLNLQLEIAIFWYDAKLIESAKEYPAADKEIKALAKKVEAKLSAVQIREFPVMRRDYIKVSSQNLWKTMARQADMGKQLC